MIIGVGMFVDCYAPVVMGLWDGLRNIIDISPFTWQINRRIV